MQTIEKFLLGTGICLRCREVSLDWDHRFLIAESRAAKQYLCELHGASGDSPVRKMMASDNGPPHVADVVDTVAAEAAVVEETRCYEAWAERMGFDPDSRHGEQIYRTERRQARVLRALLGGERYRKLLWETERM